MASGTDVTGDGLTTMTQVVAGTDLIAAADFNNARTNLDKLLGGAYDVTLGTYDPTFSYGWNQGGAGVAAASAGNTVQDTGAGGFKDLQDDIQAACAFLGVTVRTGVGSDVSTSDTITAATWNNVMLNIQDCWNARFSPTASTLSNGATAASRSGSWTNSLVNECTFTFASEGACRAWFNAGGRVGVSGVGASGGSSNTQNTQWATALSAMGDVFIYHNGTSSGAGSPAAIGFYTLTASYQTVLQYYGSAAPYSSDFIKVEAKVDSTTNPTVVTIRTTYTDAGDNAIDASPDGTFSVQTRLSTPDASGSGFTFTAPSVAAGTLTGS